MNPELSHPKPKGRKRGPNPKPTPQTAAEVTKAIQLLRSTIHEHGFTQLKIQQARGWGRTYISQLFRQQKSLRFDQILEILHTVGRDPGAFFAELFGETSPRAPEHALRSELEEVLERAFLGFLENEMREGLGPSRARRLARSFLTHLERSAARPEEALSPEESRSEDKP